MEPLEQRALLDAVGLSPDAPGFDDTAVYGDHAPVATQPPVGLPGFATGAGDPFEPTATKVTQLPIGGKRFGSLAAPGDFVIYQVEPVSAGEHLVIQFDSDQPSANNQLYVRYGSPPSLDPPPAAYDAADRDGSYSDRYVDIVGTQAGRYYVLAYTSYNPYGQNYSVQAHTDATLPELSFGAWGNGATLPNPEDFAIYQVEAVSAGEHLTVQFNSDDPSSNNQLYLRHGALPTRSVYDAVDNGGSYSDRYVDVAGTQAGTYYVVAYSSYNPYGQGYDVRADTDATLPELSFGAWGNGATLPNPEDFAIYQVEPVLAGEHLTVQFNSDEPSSNNQLYLRHGALPTRGAYDAVDNGGSYSDRYVDVAGTQAGTYYVVAYSSYNPYGQGYDVRADTDATLPLLPFGHWESGNLALPEDFAVYRVEDVVAGEQMMVQFDSDHPSAINQLYLRHGALPTRAKYDAADTAGSRSDRYVDVVATQAGTYYVVAYASYNPYGQGYRIRADLAALVSRRDTVGLYDPASGGWHLKNSNAQGGGANLVFRFGPRGNHGWQAITGDWDGDGIDTVGLYDPDNGAFHLKNTNASLPGGADVVFRFGPRGGRGWEPLAGDWNADGIDTVGLYDPSAGAFHLKNVNAGSPGGADVAFRYGPRGSRGWQPLAGDWNADATDTVGLYDPHSSVFHLKNVNAALPRGADVVFRFGPTDADWQALAGDWSANGTDTIGLYDPAGGALHLKNINANPPNGADVLFRYGPRGNRGWQPITGDWNGAGSSAKSGAADLAGIAEAFATWDSAADSPGDELPTRRPPGLAEVDALFTLP